MKSIVFVALCLFTIQSSAQLVATPTCPALVVDVLAGNVNRILSPKSTMGEVEKALPCFTDRVAGDSIQCSAVIFKDKGLYFYPQRNYIEVRDNFKGTMTPAIMGSPRGSLFRTLGLPKLKDPAWEAYTTEYGLLVVYYNKAGKIDKLQITTRSTDTMKVCE